MKRILLPLLAAFAMNAHATNSVAGEADKILVEAEVLFGIPSDAIGELCSTILAKPFKNFQSGYLTEIKTSAQANCVEKLSNLKTYSVVKHSGLKLLAK